MNVTQSENEESCRTYKNYFIRNIVYRELMKYTFQWFKQIYYGCY